MPEPSSALRTLRYQGDVVARSESVPTGNGTFCIHLEELWQALFSLSSGHPDHQPA